MKRIAIIGSGDLSQHIAYYAEEDNHYQVTGYFDDYKQCGELSGAHPVIGKIEDIIDLFKKEAFDSLIIGIGYKHFSFRKNIFEKYRGIIPFGTIIHSSTYVAPSSQIGEGCVILPGCVIDKNVKVCENVFCNIAVNIAHDTIIGPHTFISPAASFAGFVNVGSCCNIGINTTVIDNISIVSHVQTGAGSVVTSNIYDPGLYMGVPARYKRPI